MKNLLLYCLVSLAFFSCKNEKNSQEVTEPAHVYTLTAFEPSASFEDAAINSYTYKDTLFDFKVADGSYTLGAQTPDAPQKMCANSGKGQHIHLIVDDKPYAAKYESSFTHEVEDGEHYILAFLSRSYHESIKTEDAHTAQKVVVKNNSLDSATDIKSPMLFYSRPKGTYVGQDTKKVMLDFYLVNTELGDNKVIADINGEIQTLDSWQPYYIEGLPMGENTIKLSLVDKDGKLVDTPLNPVSRTFTLKEDPIEEK